MPELDAHWWWLIVAVGLAIAEILAPGIFLIWLAVAAGITGFLTWLFPVPASVGFQMVTFAVLALGSVYIGRTLIRRHPSGTSDPVLNNRAGRLIGEVGTVVESIVSGRGRVQIGDSPWPATGPDVSAGERVRVIGVDGTRLKVEPYFHSGG